MSGAFKKPVFSFKLLKILTVTLLAIPVASHLLSRHGAAVARRAQRCYSSHTMLPVQLLAENLTLIWCNATAKCWAGVQDFICLLYLFCYCCC